MAKAPIIAITMGDPAGIGPEICLKAVLAEETRQVARPIIVGDSRILEKTLSLLHPTPHVRWNNITSVSEADFQSGTVNVFDLQNIQPTSFKIGKTEPECGRASVEYILTAIQLAKGKQVDAITTAPINKEAMNRAGFAYEGHTQILAEQTHAKSHAMLFVADRLWVVLATTHIALRDVPTKLTEARVLETIVLGHDFVKKMKQKTPRLGVAGLNPHAGEGGLFGDEDSRIIAPAVQQAQKQGMDVKGPLAPDAIFYLAQAGVFDIVVAMYHDQGLIPIKFLAFNKSVNITVGLPIVRTSVDHGTGYDIAGKGWANPGSLIKALGVAAQLAQKN